MALRDRGSTTLNREDPMSRAEVRPPRQLDEIGDAIIVAGYRVLADRTRPIGVIDDMGIVSLFGCGR
jgi:hypothetical protein